MASVSAEHQIETEYPDVCVEPIRFDARELDASLSPRTDLDAFVNARWRRANPVPPDRSCWDSFAILAERTLHVQAEIAAAAADSDAEQGSVERIVGDFWASGMAGADPHGIDLLHAELARIDALASPASIWNYLCGRHARGCGLVFRFDVEPDFDDPGRMLAYVGQGGLGLCDRESYFDASPRGFAKRATYEAHIATMLRLSGTASAKAALQASDVLAFESELARVSMSQRALARDVAARFRRVDVDEADRENAIISWRAFFAAFGIEVPATFSLGMPEFQAKLAELLHATPPAIWRAYLRFHTIDDAAPYLDDEFALSHHRFHGEALRGKETMPPRWKRTLEAIGAQAGEAMGQLYVARSFPPEAKHQLRQLVQRLRAALRARLQSAAWMSAGTRYHALEKLAALNVKIGYPDRWRDWSGLATSRRSLYANVLAARAFNQRWRAGRIGAVTDRNIWPMPPQAINAGYDPARNEVVFPAAILAPPFFDPDADAALNYGGIGAVIAHEMLHGYDDQGSRFGADGRFDNWWSEADRSRFDALASRLADEFDHLQAGPEHIDGRLTLGENIADFGGLAVAFDALSQTLKLGDASVDPMIDGYTQAQRFFLNWAVIWRQNLTPDEKRYRLRTDPHAPAPVRANAAPAHMRAFAEAFGCVEGDPMRRAAGDCVQIW